MLLSEKIDADSVGIPVACEASSLPFHYFATHDLIESAHVPLCELAQEQWACFSRASGRGWYGCPRPLSPLKEVSLAMQS
jgi:hypothetical protein